MSVQFSAFDPTSITTGSIPDKIRFYYSASKKIGNYFYCYPISSGAKSFISAESWAADSYNYDRARSSIGNFLYDEVDNNFKDIQLFGIAERTMTNRRLFKVILNRKFIVELTEEMLLETLMAAGSKKGGMLNGSFRFGYFNSQLKLYPRVKHIEDELIKLNKEKQKKDSLSTKSNTITHANTKLTYKVGHVYKSGSKAIDKYVFIGRTPNKKYLFLLYNEYSSNYKVKNPNCLTYSDILKNKKINVTDICNDHLHLTVSKPKYIIELSDVFSVFSLDDLKVHLQNLDSKNDQSFFDKHLNMHPAYGTPQYNANRNKYFLYRYKRRINDIFTKNKKITKFIPGRIYSKQPYDSVEYIYIGKSPKSGKDMFVYLYSLDAVHNNYSHKTIIVPDSDTIKKTQVLNANQITKACIFTPEKHHKTITCYHEDPNINIKIFSLKDLENQIKIHKQNLDTEFLDLNDKRNYSLFGMINNNPLITNKQYILNEYNTILNKYF